MNGGNGRSLPMRGPETQSMESVMIKTVMIKTVMIETVWIVEGEK